MHIGLHYILRERYLNHSVCTAVCICIITQFHHVEQKQHCNNFWER